jgi:ADP-heptose:LPS heptosyltransferase
MADDSTALADASHPVAFFANGIGDAILALPALRALTEVFPGRLTLLAHGGAGYLDLLKPLATGRQLYLKSGTKCDWEREDIDALASAVGECDLFISLIAWHSQSLGYLIERLSPAKTVGYSAGYDIRLPRDYTKHTAELTFDAVRAVSPGRSLRDYLDPPSYPSRSVMMAEEVKASLGSGVRLLAVHMETLAEKLWEPGKLAALLDRFLSAHPEYIALLVNYADYPLALQSEAGRKRLIVQKGLSLTDALCLVHYADCFLGADSCMLHAADFGRVPAVGLFGPTSADEFGFLVGPHIAIQSTSAVSRIEVECVLAAMESLLAAPHQHATWRV